MEPAVNPIHWLYLKNTGSRQEMPAYGVEESVEFKIPLAKLEKGRSNGSGCCHLCL